MKDRVKPETALRGELRRVRARLAEVEATLEAIRGGEIDAIVVNGPQGDRIFTLQTADQPYRVLAESLNEGTATLTADGTILFCNRRLAEMLGCPAEKLVGASVISRLVGWGEKILSQLLAVTPDGCLRKEVSLLRDDGTEIPVLLSLNRMPLNDNTNGVCLVATDLAAQKTQVSELRRTQEELHTTSLYTRSLIEASLDPLVTISREGKITDVNDATEAVTGVPRQRLIGTDFCDYFTQPEEARKGYEQVFAQGQVRDYALVIRHTSGAIRDVLYNASVFRNEKGEIEGVFAAARDVTERKRTEEKLRQQAALLDLAQDAIIVRGLDNRIRFWSRGASDTYGFSAEEAVGAVGHELLNTEFPGTLEDIKSSIQGAREWEGELRHVRRDGKPIVVSSRWSLLRDGKGRPTAVMEINRDVTERKRAEEDIRRLNQELEQRVEQRTSDLQAAIKELEAFSYSVSHDLRAPLRAVEGFSRILLQDEAVTLSEDGRHCLDMVRQSTLYMSELIDGLLAFSRMGRRNVARQLVTPGDIVHRALEELQPEQENRQVQIKVGELPSCHADPLLLRQVFVNLLSNALKYTRPKEVAEIEVGAAKFHDLVLMSDNPLLPPATSFNPKTNVFYVRDNGVGFSMEYAGKLFGVFQRLHAREEFEGTGVGLATVKRIVHKHGGQVWAESRPNEGATFYFTIEDGPGIEHPEAQVENRTYAMVTAGENR